MEYKKDISMKHFKFYFRIFLLSLFGTLTTSCALFILAVGGIEKNISNDPAFAHLFNKTYAFRENVFVYRYENNFTYDIIDIGTFGSFSNHPQSIEDYKKNKEKYPFIIQIIPAGTRFSINKVISLTGPSGMTHDTILIDLYGYDFCGYRIDASSVYYGAGEHVGTMQPRWVKEVENTKAHM